LKPGSIPLFEMAGVKMNGLCSEDTREPKEGREKGKCQGDDADTR